MATDIRWIQRLSNLKKAFGKLSEAADKSNLSQLEQEGFIQRFEYTYELAWNTIKDFYENQGVTDIQGSKDAFRLAHERSLIDDGKVWMDMIESRKLSVHAYDEETADEIAEKIKSSYVHRFQQLIKRLEQEAKGQIKL